MTAFIAIGAVMVLAALATVLWPMLARASGRRPWSNAALAIALVPALAAGLYVVSSDWKWGQPAPEAAPPAVLEMVGRLEQRLKTDSSNVDGWLMLGRSYFHLGRYTDAINAYQRAYTLTRGTNVDAVLGLGEAMAMSDESTLSGPAAELFNQALELAPRHPKALWLGGLAAYQTGNLPAARDRWSALLTLEPPPQIKQILQAKLQEIETQLAHPPDPNTGGSSRE